MPRTSHLIATIALVLVVSVPAHARRRAVQPSPVPFDELHSQGGYASATSVVQGGAIRFHIATSISPFTVTVFNLANRNLSLKQINGLTSRPQRCSGHFRTGCGWDVTTTLDVPFNWPSGYYAATFPTAFGTRHLIFVVRAAQPGAMSKILAISPTHTYQAFNTFGGKSFHPSDAPDRATAVSFDRPYETDAGLGRFELYERHFVDWMTALGRPFDVATDMDLEDPTLLRNYNAVILVGHSEYWTPSARQNLEEFSRSGGHIAVLSGNSMWWQARLEDDQSTLVAYQSASLDPASQDPDGIVTTNFFAHPVNQPENRILGTSYRNGGYANRLDDPNPNRFQIKPIEDRTPWTVVNAQDWVFEGTGLAKGATFGRDAAGLQVDGVVFNCDFNQNVIGPDGSDEAPLNYHILAILPASEGWGTMGYYVNPAGGAVFNAATTGWVWGLEGNDEIRRITANVLNRFATGARFVFDEVKSPILAQDLFNCAPTGIALPGWRSAGPRGSVTASCAFEGPGGLELSGLGPIGLARSFAPAGQSRGDVEIRFYVKADDLVRRTEIPVALVTLQHRTGNAVRQVAHIELDVSGDTRQIRMARRNPDGSFAATTAWVPLPNGWRLVEATWRSPGTLALQLDGGTVHTLDNPHAGQTANEMVIELPAAQLTQGGRLCIDAIAAGSEKPGRVAELK